MDLLSTLDLCFRDAAPLAPGDGVVVAFSVGPDSTALLWGLSRLAPGRGLRLHAAHLDHALDAGSAERAAAAARMAAQLGVPLILERRRVDRRAGDGVEAAGRRARYDFLERTRRRLGARWIATGHHLDDQAETVLLRLLFGSGLEGLAGVRPICGAVARPLLEVPRAALRDALAAAGLAGSAVADPTNRDLAVPRNRVRHRLLPVLAADDPEVALRLARLAASARGAAAALDRRLAGLLPVWPVPGGLAVERTAVESLAAALRPHAFAWLHRRTGAPYPAGAAARNELGRQLADGARAGCDCGDGWRWEVDAERLVLRRANAGGERVPDFTYTLEIPGELAVPEIAVRVRVTWGPVEPWMFQGSPRRAGLALPLAAGDRVTIRNRRPGDRIHPLGAGGSRRLKEVFIDRRVPRAERASLPLLCVGGRIAWAPGVTIDQSFRLDGHATAWVAEVLTR